MTNSILRCIHNAAHRWVRWKLHDRLGGPKHHGPTVEANPSYTTPHASCLHQPPPLLFILHIATIFTLLTFDFTIAFAQSRDIRAHAEYGTAEGELRLKYEFYHDMWSERDVKHGRYCEWQSNDRLHQSGYYFDGLQDSLWQFWYLNGNMQESSWWENGVRHGKTSSYDRHGKIITERTYIHGTLHGLATDYYPNGKVRAILQYQNGVLHGNVTTYNKKGIRKDILQYQEGKRVQMPSQSKPAKEPKPSKEANPQKQEPQNPPLRQGDHHADPKGNTRENPQEDKKQEGKESKHKPENSHAPKVQPSSQKIPKAGDQTPPKANPKSQNKPQQP